MKYIAYILILTVFIECKTEIKKSDVGQTSNTEKEINSPVIGKWIVINSTILPFEHISYCEKLELNSVFEFETNGKLNVYESHNGKKCTKDQTFKVRGSKLWILEWDMAFEYDIVKLSLDSLQLKIDRTPDYFWTESNLNDKNIQKKLKEIKNNGIVVTLIKIKNGG